MRTREHARLLAARGIRSVDLTPGRAGPGRRAAGQPRRARGRGRGQPDHLRSAGHDPDRGRGQRVGRRRLRGDGLDGLVALRRPGHAPEHRRVHDARRRAALETVGGAREAKAIIILNPADPPVMMRNTIYLEVADPDREAIEGAIAAAVAGRRRLRARVPPDRAPLIADGVVTVMLEVEGAGDNLPAYAGNLDIMTSAAVRVAELYAEAAA